MNDDDTDDINSNALIQKLRQQSIDNKERNDLAIERQTFENNQVRMFSLLYVCMFRNHNKNGHVVRCPTVVL
jgi:hypothetical protein